MNAVTSDLAERPVLWVEGADGVRIATEAFGPEDGDPIILLHGGGQTRRAWRRAADQLAARGWCAITVDLRGHGESDWAHDGRYGYDQYSGDLQAIRRTLSRPAVLVGASLGGKIALAAAGDGGAQMTRALVLVDTVPRNKAEGVARAGAVFQGPPDGFASPDDAAAFLARNRGVPPKPGAGEALRRSMRQRADGRWVWHWDPAAFRPEHNLGTVPGMPRLEAAAARLRVPVLLIHGGKSDVVDAAGIEALRAICPQLQTTLIPEAGHMLVGDKNDEFVDALLAFLTNLPPQS